MTTGKRATTRPRKPSARRETVNVLATLDRWQSYASTKADNPLEAIDGFATNMLDGIDWSTLTPAALRSVFAAICSSLPQHELARLSERADSEGRLLDEIERPDPRDQQIVDLINRLPPAARDHAVRLVEAIASDPTKRQAIPVVAS